jgi:hypothetical protein
MQEWMPIVRTMNFRVRDDAAASVDGRELVPAIADFSDLGAAFVNVVRLAWGLPAEAAAAAVAPKPSRPSPIEIESEVAHALAHLRDLVSLRSAPLGERLFASNTDAAERAKRLQAWLLEAIASTERMRQGALVLKAMHASFEATRTVDEAAAVAGMGFSTLKRYRKLGVVRITELAMDALERSTHCR